MPTLLTIILDHVITYAASTYTAIHVTNTSKGQRLRQDEGTRLRDVCPKPSILLLCANICRWEGKKYHEVMEQVDQLLPMTLPRKPKVMQLIRSISRNAVLAQVRANWTDRAIQLIVDTANVEMSAIKNFLDAACCEHLIEYMRIEVDAKTMLEIIREYAGAVVKDSIKRRNLDAALTLQLRSGEPYEAIVAQEVLHYSVEDLTKRVHPLTKMTRFSMASREEYRLKDVSFKDYTKKSQVIGFLDRARIPGQQIFEPRVLAQLERSVKGLPPYPDHMYDGGPSSSNQLASASHPAVENTAHAQDSGSGGQEVDQTATSALVPPQTIFPDWETSSQEVSGNNMPGGQEVKLFSDWEASSQEVSGNNMPGGQEVKLFPDWEASSQEVSDNNNSG
jgi:hypothetical protein